MGNKILVVDHRNWMGKNVLTESVQLIFGFWSWEKLQKITENQFFSRSKDDNKLNTHWKTRQKYSITNTIRYRSEMKLDAMLIVEFGEIGNVIETFSFVCFHRLIQCCPVHLENRVLIAIRWPNLGRMRRHIIFRNWWYVSRYLIPVKRFVTNEWVLFSIIQDNWFKNHFTLQKKRVALTF